MAVLRFILAAFCILQTVEAGGVNNNPGTVWLQENYDGTHNLWSIDSYCYVRYTYSYSCYSTYYYSCGWWGYGSCMGYYWYTCYAHAWTDVVCNVCAIRYGDAGHFQMSGTTVQKKSCSSPYCGPTCSGQGGCLNSGESYDVGIYCYRTGYETADYVPDNFYVRVSAANGPSFYFSNTAYIEISHDNVGVGSVINTIVPSTSDNGYDYDYPRYRQSRAPGPSYLHQTSDLFKLDTINGQIKVNKDLTYEFSYFYNMEVCVYDRRNREVCHQLDVKLWACFQTPNCTNQEEWSLHDTYGTYTGHGGSSNLVFRQIYPNPSEHFRDHFSSSWHKLKWTWIYNQFPEVDIDQNSGDMFVTTNISIWPAWPTKDYRMRVQVENTESCYKTTCDFFVRVHYTNWPIEIRSLPNHNSQFEDDDDGHLIHSLVVYDYNDEGEDNMTCNISRISPHEDNLFDLQHDGRYKWNSYTLYKLECQNRNCGYKHPPFNHFRDPNDWRSFYCDTDIGCLTHNRTQQYTVTVKCDDAYNTTDEKDFTFYIYKNQAPRYRELPTQRDFDKHKISKYDNIFEILYWDNEKEELFYEYNFTDVEPPNADPFYFTGSAKGNFHDKLGNITMTTHLWDKPSNKSYRIHICGHERRNEICEDLIVNVEEYCSEAPTCNDSDITVDMTVAVGTHLFDISSLVNPPSAGSFHDLSYSIKSAYGNYFDVDSITGQVSVANTFPEVYPSAIYAITGQVHETGACDKGTCQLIVTVNFVNHPISITNDRTKNTASIHEDETAVKTLLTVTVADNNTDDSYTCVITNSNNGPFYLDRSPPKTGLYYLKNRENYALTSDPPEYDLEIACSDEYGSSDTFTFTVEIKPNLAPAFAITTDWSPRSVHVESTKKKDVVFTVSASDKEEDDITWTCTVDTNMNPLACNVYAAFVEVYIRRSLKFEFDDGRNASVKICIKDKKHTATCNTASFTFSSTLTAPSISNINDWPISISEDTAINTILYTATVSNPDVGETSTVIMNVFPKSYNSFFKFNQGAKQLILAKQLDYEKIKEVRFEFAVKDNYLMGLVNYTVFLHVTNVNEGNTLTAEKKEITFPEDKAPGSVLPDIGLKCIDIDGDNVTLSIIDAGNYSSFFSLDAYSGKLTLLKTWDLESNIAPEASLVIQCADSGGETSTVVVDVIVTDVNEFEPLCSITYIASNPLRLSPSTSLFVVLLTIECTDPDRDSGGDFIAAPLGFGIAAKYFRVLSRSGRKRAAGTTYFDVKLKDSIDLSNDKSFETTIMISDGDGNSLFSGITLSVNFTAADPDAKSKESKRCLSCTTNGQVIIGVLVIEVVIIVLFVIHACCSMMCHKNKVLKLSDFDVSTNKRFRLPSKTVSSPNKPVTPSSIAVIPHVNTKSGNMQRQEASSSGSSSSEDSDDDNVNRKDIGRGKFTPRQSLPSMHPIGLPSPVYTGSVRSGGINAAKGHFAPVNQQPTGLPAPIYCSIANSQASSKSVSNPGFIE